MTTAATRDRAEHYLTWVNREIDRLRALDAEGGTTALAVEERMATRLEWDDVVDRYLAVVAAYDDGQLPRDMHSHLLDVSMRLTALVPALERMRLRRPDPDLLARMRLAAAS
jgi:hypothetical protein